MDELDFEAWFRLAHTPGISRSAARRLLAAFGTPRGVLDAPAKAWKKVVSDATAAALLDPPEDSMLRLLVARDWLHSAPQRRCICMGDEAYPEALLQTEDPPLMLYAEGPLDALAMPALAIVGSRNPTPEGAGNARAFAASLATQGWAIVSGLARGIDASAHEGALEVGGLTIAVIGTGPDQAYPSTNRGLMRRITVKGLVLSEYSPGTPPLAQHFPQRNRIIAALSRGCLVVEAALQSGSLITARLATEAGREVFAIPGSIHSPQSKGCHALIQQGAKLVQTAQDVLEELSGVRRDAAASGGRTDPATEGASPDSVEGSSELVEEGAEEGQTAEPVAASPSPEQRLLEALGWEPVSLDALCARTGWPVAELSAKLLECELRGELTHLPGGLYQRTRQA